MRKFSFVFLTALAALIAGGCAKLPVTPIAAQPYTRIANPDSNTVQLQIALRKFTPPERGPAVWLAGVMHIGEPEYYQRLQTFLDSQTVVLFEGINTGSHPRHVGDAAAPSGPPVKPPPAKDGGKAGYSMQSTLAQSLGLVFQLEAIDYDRTNFLNSDLSVAQIQKIMSEGEPAEAPGAGKGGGASSSFDSLLQIMDGTSFLGSLFKLGMQLMASSPQLQAVAKLTLIEAIGRLKGDMSDVQGLPPEWKKLIQVLIQARNENLLNDLKVERQKLPPRASIAVFYGAGHMDNLENRLVNELHYRPVEERWLPAFSVNLKKSGISPSEAAFMRSMIEAQVGQMQKK